MSKRTQARLQARQHSASQHGASQHGARQKIAAQRAARQYSPALLSGLSWSQVAAAIKNPGSAIGKEVNGAANMMTAELCKLTLRAHGQPGGVCSSAGVKAATTTG